MKSNWIIRINVSVEEQPARPHFDYMSLVRLAILIMTAIVVISMAIVGRNVLFLLLLPVAWLFELILFDIGRRF